MATEVHCITCFEALDAHLNHRKPLTLDTIQSSWPSYLAASKPLDPDLRRVTTSADARTDSPASSTSSSSLQTGTSTPATSTSSLPFSAIAASGPSATPLFVTWNTIEEEDNDEEVSLRGCIGTFEPTPLSEGLPEYALISAIQDTRFPPIRKSELPTLQVAVTLLTDFEEVQDPYDWEVGVHGIRLSFRDRGRRYGSTYLPDVASEQGWTKEEALFSLTRKAGWVGSQSKWKDLELKVARYRGKKKGLSYGEFKKWRDWIDSGKK